MLDNSLFPSFQSASSAVGQQARKCHRTIEKIKQPIPANRPRSSEIIAKSARNLALQGAVCAFLGKEAKQIPCNFGVGVPGVMWIDP
jgi:hypothetical protein